MIIQKPDATKNLLSGIESHPSPESYYNILLFPPACEHFFKKFSAGAAAGTTTKTMAAKQ
jgi:hypothetical protein